MGRIDKRITVQRSAVAYIPDGEDWHSSLTGAGDNQTSGESLDCWLHDDKDSTFRAGGDSDLSFFTLHQDRLDNDNRIYLLQAAKPLSLPTQDKNTGNPMQIFFCKTWSNWHEDHFQAIVKLSQHHSLQDGWSLGQGGHRLSAQVKPLIRQTINNWD